ncbi:MAG: PDZ domain-containing protein [Anaerolineaceae bacterium]|jgi:predicted metalloprotease with PDZ domain
MLNKKKIYTLIETSLLIIFLVTGCVSQNSTKNIPDQSEETKIVAYALYPEPVLGIVIDSDGKILHVEPGSAAERAGLVSGDILISIDSISVNSERDKVRDLIRSNTEEMKMEIQYQRGENVIVTQITPSQKIQQSDDQAPKLTPTPVLPPEDYL